MPRNNTRPDAETRVRALLLGLSDHTSYEGNKPGDATLSVVTCTPGGGSVRNMGSSAEDRCSTWPKYDGSTIQHPLSDGMLGDFEVFAFLDAAPDKYRQNKADTSPRGLWSQTYRFHSIYEIETPDQALALAEVLRHVKRALDRSEKLGGPPASFGWFAARIGKALGCHGVLVQISGYRPFYDANEYRLIAWENGGADAIDSRIQKWIADRQPHETLALTTGE